MFYAYFTANPGDFANGIDSFLMACKARKLFGFSPTAIAIHDNGDVSRNMTL
jgi:hypothetical protein